jgi:hypothetical protein
MSAIYNQQEKLRKMQERQAADARAIEEVKRNQAGQATFVKPVTAEDTLKSMLGRK